MAAERIKAAITETLVGEQPVKAILDPYNPKGSSRFVNFTTSKELRWETSGPPPKCPVNWVICDSDWEAEFCRVAESHPRVHAYVKNQALGFEVPYLMGAIPRRYLPDFIVRIDDGRADPLEPRRRDQGVPGRGRQGEGQHHAGLLGAGRQQPRHVRPLGLRGVHGRVRDRA